MRGLSYVSNVEQFARNLVFAAVLGSVISGSVGLRFWSNASRTLASHGIVWSFEQIYRFKSDFFLKLPSSVVLWDNVKAGASCLRMMLWHFWKSFVNCFQC